MKTFWAIAAIVVLAVVVVMVGRDLGTYDPQPSSGASVATSSVVIPTTTRYPAATTTTSKPAPTTTTHPTTTRSTTTTTTTTTAQSTPSSTTRTSSTTPSTTTQYPPTKRDEPLCGYANQEMVAVFATDPVQSHSGVRIAKGESRTVYGSTVSFNLTNDRYVLTFTPATVPAPGPTVKAYYEAEDGTIWATEMSRMALHVNCNLQPIIMGESIAAVWVDIY